MTPTSCEAFRPNMERSPLVAFQRPETREKSLARTPMTGRTPIACELSTMIGSSAGVSMTKMTWKPSLVMPRPSSTNSRSL